MSAGALRDYLNVAGILSCNVNPYLPSLSDLDCCWADVTELIARHQLFYCKAYRKRTVYLSPEAYFLLRACKTQKPMGEGEAELYSLLEERPPLETEELKRLSLLEPKRFTKHFSFLLEQRYITALANGTVLNPNWSTFRYGTAAAWEEFQPPFTLPERPEERLRALLGRTMREEELHKFLST